MESITLTSFFTKYGVPFTGLSPTVRIWEVSSTGDHTLIIGSTEGTGDPGSGIGTDGIMSEMFDKTAGVVGSGGLPIGGSQDGFYSFEFTDTMGYSKKKMYLVRIDGGINVPIPERYQTAKITPNSDMVNDILNEPIIDHLASGSVGEALNQTKANSEQLMLSIIDVEDLIRLVLKYDTNRTRIDTANYTMTVYDNDCSTPLRTFKLLDSNGIPSVEDVCERVPQATDTSDGLPTCLP